MKKRFTKAVSLMVAVLFLVACVAPAALASNKAINDARQSVVRVLADYGNGWYGTGTGFIIAQSGTTTHMVTNLHVVLGAWEVFIIPNDATGSWIPVQVTYLPDPLDLVLLTSVSGLSNRPVLPLADASAVNAADAAYALGFPGAADDVIDGGENIPSSTNDVTVTNGIISTPEVQLDGVKAFQMSVPITFGNSGGPLLNDKGHVIGVNTWKYDEDSYSIGYAIHINYIINECEQRGIPYTKASSSIFAEYWWAFAIGGGVLLIGLVIVLIVVLTKKKPAPVMQQMPHPAGHPAAAPVGAPVGAPMGAPMGGPMGGPPGAPPQYGAQPQPGPYGAPPQPVGGMGGPPRLLCTSGTFAGSAFPVNGTVVIGRDARLCQIVFPGDTKGISSVHCEVSMQPNGVRLTDKGSSYGTYTGDGRKLSANENVILRPGESFYLADRKNEFKLT